MSKNTKFFILLLVCLVTLFAGNFFRIVLNENKKQELATSLQAQPTLKKQKIMIGEKSLEVELAKSFVEQAVGLSFRESLGSDGMLFILPSRQRAGFWMKDMKFDIDIVWIKEGKVTQIQPNIKAVSYETDRTVYYPNEPIDWVLELEASQAASLGLQVGDLVVLK